MGVKNRWQAIFPEGFPDAEAIGSDRLKTAGKTALSAVGPSVSVTQTATGNATVLALATAGAAASATGIGLVVTGAAATLTLSTLAAISVCKTEKHGKGLEKIYQRLECYECNPVLAGPGGGRYKDFNGHDALELTLIYMIGQKREKAGRKLLQASIIGRPLETAYTLGRSFHKRLLGTRGVERKKHAGDLARHFIQHNCGLAQAIVANLYSYEQMRWLILQDYDVVVECLANKMKSR